MRRLRRYYECVLYGPSLASTLIERIRRLPEVNLAKVMKGLPILIVAPHPDDESLGCGGLIAQATALGEPVHIVIVTDGTGSHPRSSTHSRNMLRDLRRCETLEAAAALGVPAERVSFLDVPDGQAPQSGKGARAVGQRLASLARDIAAETIFTSWNYDTHSDHVATHKYAHIAAYETQASLFSYPVWAWMLPRNTIMPNLRLKGFSINIGPYVTMKRAAVLKHRSQTTSMIADDPSGFSLSEEQLAAMITSKEFFIAENRRARGFEPGRKLRV